MEGSISSAIMALGVLFIGLKLAGAIDWSWWWVLAPFWVPLVIAIVVIVILFVIGIIRFK